MIEEFLEYNYFCIIIFILIGKIFSGSGLLNIRVGYYVINIV